MLVYDSRLILAAKQANTLVKLIKISTVEGGWELLVKCERDLPCTDWALSMDI